MYLGQSSADAMVSIKETIKIVVVRSLLICFVMVKIILFFLNTIICVKFKVAFHRRVIHPAIVYLFYADRHRQVKIALF